MTPEDWKNVEDALSSPYGRVDVIWRVKCKYWKRREKYKICGINAPNLRKYMGWLVWKTKKPLN